MKIRRETVLNKYADGYLTVFLTLTLAVLLSLILTLVEGARINAIRMRTETAGNIAVRSVLGEFHRELLRQYDLYFIDASYGTGNASMDRVQQHLQTYMSKNLESEGGDFTGTYLESLTLEAARFAADDRAKALREQVFAYMSADPAGSVLSEILTEADTWQGLLDDGSGQPGLFSGYPLFGVYSAAWRSRRPGHLRQPGPAERSLSIFSTSEKPPSWSFALSYHSCEALASPLFS